MAFGGVALGVGFFMWKGRAPPSGKGRLRVTVKDSETGGPIEGALVVSDAVSGTTGADGVATLDLDPGEYTVTVSKAGYYSESRTVAIQEGYETRIEVLLSPTGVEPGYFPVEITAKANFAYVHEDGVPIDRLVPNWALSGGSVKLEGPKTYTTVVGADGVARFAAVREGDYTLTISRPGYDTLTEALPVHSDISITRTLIWQAVPRGEVTWNLYSDYVDAGGGYSVYPEAPPLKDARLDWFCKYNPDKAYALETYDRTPMAPMDPTAAHNYGEIQIQDPETGRMWSIPIVGVGNYLQLIGERLSDSEVVGRSYFIAQIAKEDC